MNLKVHERKHLEEVYEYLGECIVLLKKNNDFPLNEAGDIALYGSGARHTIKGGTGSGEVNSRFFVNCEEGLKNRGFNVLTTSWLDEYDAVKKRMKENFNKSIKKSAKEHHVSVIAESMGKVLLEEDYQLPINKMCDTAVYVISRLSGEGNDRLAERGDFLLTETEKKDLYVISQQYEKLLLVINAGGPVDLSEVDFVENILVLSQLGVETGNVLADFILGRINPSGKLSTSWDSYDNYCHIGDFAEIDDTRYKEGIYVGYRYFDTAGIKAKYPFGYGLSYADFLIKTKNINIDKTTVSIEVEVKNTSEKFAGKEVVQVYVSKPIGRLDKPYQDLIAFKKTDEIKPNQTQTIDISFDFTDLTSYDENSHSYIMEKGDYLIRVGNSSVNTSAVAVIELKDDFTKRIVKNCLGDTDFDDYKPEPIQHHIDKDIQRFQIDLSDIKTEQVDYDVEDEICPEIAGCDIEKLALMNVGAFDPKGGIASVIGSSGKSVAGAAGESSDLLKDIGLKNIVMADGPAGLRLSREYYKDSKGVHALDINIPESVLDMLPGIARKIIRFMNRKPRNAELLEQACTALPIGTAVAQSFNTDLAYKFGDIVGTEMELYNVDLWLAPALNIHRNVLCGRNFEYFSEDPLLSGKMAAAITKGLQSHKGKGVTIKHYAANNQETNRYGNNSMVSERAMREIYLKGFEICISESDPYAVMSSYNLLNGVHTSEHTGLCVDVLRREFGFDKILMTDWIVGVDFLTKNSKYDEPNAAKVARASHSLFMPGSKKDLNEIREGLKENIIDSRQLMVNASRLYKVFAKKDDKDC